DTTQTPNLEAQVPKGPRTKRMSGEHNAPLMGYVEDLGKIVHAHFQSMIAQKDLFSWELMDEDMVTMHTRKKLSWSIHTHMDEPEFDVCEESCVSRQLKKAHQARHMTVKPTVMSDEQ
ncbi:hypothetical protein KI387_031378, partial [Taxus chinensis]